MSLILKTVYSSCIPYVQSFPTYPTMQGVDLPTKILLLRKNISATQCAESKVMRGTHTMNSIIHKETIEQCQIPNMLIFYQYVNRNKEQQLKSLTDSFCTKSSTILNQATNFSNILLDKRRNWIAASQNAFRFPKNKKLLFFNVKESHPIRGEINENFIYKCKKLSVIHMKMHVKILLSLTKEHPIEMPNLNL